MNSFRGRIRQKDLAIPALRAAARRLDGYITTTELIEELEREFSPEGDDAKTLAGRNDSRFSQIVRNLKSHKDSGTSIFKNGLALDEPDGLRITDVGRRFLVQIEE